MYVKRLRGHNCLNFVRSDLKFSLEGAVKLKPVCLGDRSINMQLLTHFHCLSSESGKTNVRIKQKA